MVAIRILHTSAELEAVVDLEMAVWGLKPRDAVPESLMHVIALRGGLVLGAFDGAAMVGMLLALPARAGDAWILWSHMTGVHPAAQGQGVGAALKRFQRVWALEQGYRMVGWTFDPLQRGNARFNFGLLGRDAAMTTNVYHVNFYGDMDDDINRGMPSDRVEVLWHLDQPPFSRAAQPAGPLVLAPGAGGQPDLRLKAAAWAGEPVCLAVPSDLAGLRALAPGLPLAWRLAQREAMQAAFAAGYQIVDFTTVAGHEAYVLAPAGGHV